MKLIADLHIHSRYSRAVSDKMILEEIAYWAQLKGIDLVGTGDFTHHLWFREITAKLEEAGEGLFRLKEDVAASADKKPSFNSSTSGDPLRETPDVSAPLFILQQEISSIYTQGNEGRRIHNLVYSPSITTVEKINSELTKRGCNLMSDGRPIIGLSSIELCELVFGIDEKCLIVPAHIWTPYFSLYGSKSGFDSIEECFGEYAKFIYAIETGLSSDPAMNWRIKELDERAIISNSDAHSGPKLGREATIFDIPGETTSEQGEKISVTYMDIYQAIKTANYSDKTKPRIAGTIEFYPEEGKYHFTGHRNCKVRYSPDETRQQGTTCPVCGKPLTIGVMHRVEELAEPIKAEPIKAEPLTSLEGSALGVQWIFHPENKKPPYTMLVPLFEVICEVLGGTIYAQNVQNEYQKLTSFLGSEFFILLKAKLEDIERVSGSRLAEAIKKNRSGDIKVIPGYDGQFGTVKIFTEKEEKDEMSQQEQLGMF